MLAQLVSDRVSRKQSSIFTTFYLSVIQLKLTIKYSLCTRCTRTRRCHCFLTAVQRTRNTEMFYFRDKTWKLKDEKKNKEKDNPGSVISQNLFFDFSAHF